MWGDLSRFIIGKDTFMNMGSGNPTIVLTRCPDCGRDMPMPRTLREAHCVYCGASFSVSEAAVPISLVIQYNEPQIENYVKLMIKTLSAGNREKGEMYFEKATELDVDLAHKVADRYIKEIIEAYLPFLIEATERFCRLPKNESTVVHQRLWDRALKSVEDIDDKIDEFMMYSITSLSCCIPDNFHASAEAQYQRGLRYAHMVGSAYSVEMEKSGHDRFDRKCWNRAVTFFHRCLLGDPSREDARSRVWELGETYKEYHRQMNEEIASGCDPFFW